MKTYLTPLIALLLSTNILANEKPAPNEVKKTVANAEDKSELAEKAAKELANPNTVFATMNFKLQYSGGYDNGGNNFTTVFQPSMPMPLANGDKIFFRPAIGYSANMDQPNGNDNSGFTDLSFDLAYAPQLADPTTLVAMGAYVTLPTGSKGFSGDQYAIGPELFLGKLSTKRVIGALNTHQWGFGEDFDRNSQRDTINRTGVQLIWVEIAGGGWTYGSVPMMNYDWNTNQAEIPLNLMISKTLILGARPWKIGMEFNYYVEKDEQKRPDYMISFNISPVVENKLAGLLQ